MQHYELLILLPGKLSEAEVPGSEQIVREICSTSDFAITREESLGKRKLSYDIRGEQYGYYHCIEGDAEPSAIKNLEERLRLNPSILRHGIYEKPVQSKETVERELRFRERVAHARATKAALGVAAKTASDTPPVTAASTVDVAALDKKLEELLTTPDKV